MESHDSKNWPRLEGYNPMSPEVAVNPYPVFARARQEAPVFYSDAMGMWIITRYADVEAATRDTRRFSSHRSTALADSVCETIKPVFPEGQLPEDTPTLINNDPPGHTKMRRLINKIFTPRSVAEREPDVRQIVDRLIDRFVTEGSVELVSWFSQLVPAMVITRMLGIPEQDALLMAEWVDNRLSFHDPHQTDEQLLARAKRHHEFCDYLATLAEDRRGEPRDDLITKLVQVRDDESEGGGQLSTLEVVSFAVTLVIGGQDTTANLISNMIYQLLAHPEQLEQVRQQPELIPAVVEETLRYRSSALGLFRTTTQPVRIGGTEIPACARVQLHWGSANHDETQFACPEAFDIHRSNAKKHLGFGIGPHFCPGAPLARLEARIALERLLTRLPNLRLDPNGEVQFQPHAVVYGPIRMDLAWDI